MDLLHTYITQIWNDWTAWRACQYADDEHKELVDEIYSPLFNRLVDLYWYMYGVDAYPSDDVPY